MSLGKVSYQSLRFFCIFKKSGKNEATDLAFSQLQGSTIVIISAHVPGQHMWTRAGPGLSSSSPKQCKSDGLVKIYNSASARSQLTKSKKKKNIESAAIKKALVSVHRRAWCRAKWQRLDRVFQHSSEIKPMTPDCLLLTLTSKPSTAANACHWFVSIAVSQFATCNQFVCIQDCCAWIFQVEYQGQERIPEFLNANL